MSLQAAAQLQRTAPDGGHAAAPRLVQDVLRSPGRPLEPAVLAETEDRFGHDFSQVRIHTDARSAESARAVNARAYTVGREVVFDSGRYAPGTRDGRRLLAHELTHVMQQRGVAAQPSVLTIAPPRGPLEAEADRLSRGDCAPIVQRATGGVLQRDLATEPPAVAAPAQPDLTDEQIQAAITFNRARYDAANTRLIQSLLGGPVTGTWTEEHIVAIASTQEEYGLKKDGKVGHDTFVFLNREQRAEGMPTTTENCLVAFRLIGPQAQTFRRDTPTRCFLGGGFRTEAEFSSRCNCAQFQYRQFIRGHFRRTRGGATEDIGAWFADLPAGPGSPAGRIDATFKEDGDTTDVPVNYGHRDGPADNDPVDHYFDRAGTDNQATGCRYESEDNPGGDLLDCQPGDSYDVDVSFRGEIQRNGAPIQTKFWTAIRRANWRP
jgi:hypothetical protein